MKKSLLTILALTAALVPAQAQLGNDGFYRVRSVTKPTDYVTLVDNQFSYNHIMGDLGGGISNYLKDADKFKTACMKGVQEYLATDIAMAKTEAQITDPGTILYFKKKSGSSYDFEVQGTSLHEIATGTYTYSQKLGNITINTVYATVNSTADTPAEYEIGIPMKFTYTYKLGFIPIPVDADLGTNYFCDENGSTLSFLERSNENRFWYIEPINDTDNYFAVKPVSTLKQNGKYYTTLRTSFSYKVKDATTTTVYAVTDTPKNGVATLRPYKAGDIIPAGMPVVIESTSAEAADNILVPQGVATSTITTALYNNYGMPAHDITAQSGDGIGYFKKAYKGTATLYKLSTNDKGQVGFFTPVASGEVINGNEAYATASCALFKQQQPQYTTTTLSDLAQKGLTNKDYKVTGNGLKAVANFKTQSGDRYIVVTDGDQAVNNYVADVNQGYDYAIDGHNQRNYTQNNWLLVKVSTDEQYDLEGQNITSITGRYVDASNPTLEATAIEAPNTPDALVTYTPNVYCPVNFTTTAQSPLVQGKYGSGTRDYFFMTPKRNEWAHIVYAVPNEGGTAFTVPESRAGINGHNFAGEVSVSWDYNADGNVSDALSTSNAYVFDAIVKENVPVISAPARVAAQSRYTIFPLNINRNNPVTAVSSVSEAATVERVIYYNLQGQSSAKPHEGVNIVKTVYTDGSTRVDKVVK